MCNIDYLKVSVCFGCICLDAGLCWCQESYYAVVAISINIKID